MAKRRRKSLAGRPGGLPKGAYRSPDGNHMVTGPWGLPNQRGRRIRITGIHRAEPDAKKLAVASLAVLKQELLEHENRKSTEQESSEK